MSIKSILKQVYYFYFQQNFTKNIIETFKPDISIDPENTDILNKIISHHFYKLGEMDIADELLKVS